MAKFAEYTKVPISQSKDDIERTLTRYGAKDFASFSEATRAILIFHAHDRRLRFDLPLPAGGNEKDERVRRQRWRALLLAIKAKLESVETGIETFEEAFLSHIVLTNGLTVYQATKEPLAIEYKTGNHKPLLPDYSKDAT